MKKIARPLITFCLLLLSIKALAQPSNEGNDRIKQLLKSIDGHTNDTDKVKLLNDLAFEYNKISPYDGIRYGIQSLSLAEELKWEIGKARANSCIGANYYSLSDYPNAYKYWLNSLKINEKLGNNIGVANHLHNIGNIYFSQKNYAKAQEYYQQALDLSEHTGNKPIVTASYTAIGNIYAQQREYSKALEYHFKALAIDEEIGIKGNVALDQINIGTIYCEQGNLPKALTILLEAKQIKTSIGDKNGTAKALSIIGKVYLQIAQILSSDPITQNTYGTRAFNLGSAVSYLDSAIEIDKSIGYLDNMQQCYLSLSKALEMQGDEKAALTNYKRYTSLRDSIFSMDKQIEINNMEKRAELESKSLELEKEKEKESKAEFIQVSAISAFIMVLISSLLVLRKKKINPRVIDLLGTFSLLIMFEFIELIIHGQIEKLTYHNFTLTLIGLLGLAALVTPIHERIHKWMKQKIGHK